MRIIRALSLCIIKYHVNNMNSHRRIPLNTKNTPIGVFFLVLKAKIYNKRCRDVLIAIVIIFAAIMLLALCLIRINIAIEYKRQGVNDHITMSLFILKGLIKYKYEIPKVDTEKKGLLFRKLKEKGKKEKEVSKKKEKLSYSYILKKIQTYNDYIKDNHLLLRRIHNYLRCRVNIKKFDLDIIIGTDNAHQTAILIGVLWSLTGILLSVMHNNFNLLEKNISIKPEYMGKKLKVDLFCILNVRIGHIIIVGLICLMHIKPFRKIAYSMNLTQKQSNYIF